MEDRAVLAAAVEYLAVCFRRKSAPRLSELADQLQTTSSRITRSLVRTTGLSTSHYFKREQVHFAERLIAQGIALDEVAQCAGFGTRRTFYRVFRQQSGMTPNEYRRDCFK